MTKNYCSINLCCNIQFLRLELVASIGMHVLYHSTSESDTTPDIFENALQQFLHGLFDFYFNEHHKVYDFEDVTWFLQIANQQKMAFSSQALCEFTGRFNSSGKLDHIGSLCTFKHYLLRLLHMDDSKNKLLKFNPKVNNVIIIMSKHTL